jgi:hypothetical protein
MGLATTPGNSVSIETKGYCSIIDRMVLISASKLELHTSRIRFACGSEDVEAVAIADMSEEDGEKRRGR